MPKACLKYISLFVSGCIAILVYFLIQNILQYTTQRIELLGHFPADVKVTVKNLAKNGHIEELDVFRIRGSKELQRVGTTYINKHVHRLQFEFDNPSGEALALGRIKLFFPYLGEHYYTEENISKYFDSVHSTPESDRQYVGKKIIVQSNVAMARSSLWIGLFLSSLFFIGAFLLLRHVVWQKIPAFEDMNLGNKISSRNEFNTINGIRGLAALLVLFSHTAPRFESVQMGLSLLFVISGFLLAKPFVLDANKIFNLGNIEQYIVKRLKRILPMYYLYVFIIFGVSLNLETLARHLVFLQGDGHLWPMTQIFAFYMLLPLVLFVCSAAYRLHHLLPVILLAMAAFFSYNLLGEWQPFYNGRFYKEFFLYSFLLGVLGAYLHYDLLALVRERITEKRNLNQLLGVIVFVITVLAILWSAPIKPIPMIWVWMSQFWVKCILSVIIIVLALNTHRSIFSLLVGNWVFRSVGVIGFSFYILHGLGMQIFAELQRQMFADPIGGERSWEFVLGSFVITYIMAVITYSYIERPFFGYRHNKEEK